MQPLTFCRGMASLTKEDVYFCKVCGSSYNSYLSALALKLEAYQAATSQEDEDEQEYRKQSEIIRKRMKNLRDE